LVPQGFGLEITKRIVAALSAFGDCALNYNAVLIK